MPEIQLRIDQLILDTENPRITHSENQRQALQKVIRDQKSKLVRLAESIVERGLSPIERIMVQSVSARPKRYIALEGNRRVAALTLLNNPSAIQGLDAPKGFQRSFERLASNFVKSNVEPIKCFEVQSLEEGRFWIELRHNGEDDGRGIVDWKPIVAARFRNNEPAVQALDLVLEHGGLSDDEADAIKTGFSLTTLRRLIESPKVQGLIGITIKDGKLKILIEPSELLKPLKRIVADIAQKRVDSRTFNKSQQMTEYIAGFEKGDKPDLSKTAPERPAESIETREVTKTSRQSHTRRSSATPANRKTVVPKGCPVKVTDNRIAEIYRELQTLKLEEARNAIAVLMRVFLELSIDHFLEANGSSPTTKTGGGEINKKLDKKLAEVVDMLSGKGMPKRHLDPIVRSLSVQTSPMNINLFHQYVHNRFATPSPQELTAAWDQSQPLFENIWP